MPECESHISQRVRLPSRMPLHHCDTFQQCQHATATPPLAAAPRAMSASKGQPLKRGATKVINAQRVARAGARPAVGRAGGPTPASGEASLDSESESVESRPKTEQYEHVCEELKPVIPDLQGLLTGSMKLYRASELQRITRETLGIIAVVRGEQEYAKSAELSLRAEVRGSSKAARVAPVRAAGPPARARAITPRAPPPRSLPRPRQRSLPPHCRAHRALRLSGVLALCIAS